MLEQPDLSADPQFLSNSLRAKNKAAWTQITLASFAELTTGNVIERLDRAGIANAKSEGDLMRYL